MCEKQWVMKTGFSDDALKVSVFSDSMEIEPIGDFSVQPLFSLKFFSNEGILQKKNRLQSGLLLQPLSFFSINGPLVIP